MKAFATLALIAAASIGGGASAETTILPGYWESTNHLSFVMEQQTTSRKCITADQVESYLSAPANKHYSCVYNRRKIGDGKVALAGVCTDNGGRKIDVDITGVYTKTSFDLNAQLAANLLGLPMVGAATTKAHRLSEACPDPQAK